MPSPKTKRAFLAAGVLCAAGFIVWPGCATPPLPASRTPVSSLKRADFSFGKGAHPGRDEIVAKVGHPDEYFADLHVACYKLNKIKRRRLMLLFGILPIGAPLDPDGIEAAMIRFDDRDRAERITIRIISGYYYGQPGTLHDNAQRGTLHDAAQRWIAEPTRVPQRH